jgi:spoIIIJ-associated protein
MSIETQQQLASDFVKEVVARFGLEATTTARRTEDDGIYVSVEGDNLGLLVGPKGATVEALQELTRTVVQRHTDEHTSRIVVDVGGYRERRAAALRQFVLDAAADVLRTGVPEALEPMSPSDRKIVHDTVNELEGLATTSEGVEPRRYVVIRASSAASTDQGPDPAESVEELEDESNQPADPA